MKLTKEMFIERSKEKHGDYYDYSKVEYKNTKTKVIIICPIHGEFQQTAEGHMMGKGCAKCSQRKLEATNMAKYGVKRPLQSKSIHDKVVETNLETYGAVNPMCTAEVQEKAKITNRKRYGVDYTCQADSVRVKKEATLQGRYGGNSPFSSPEVQEKAHDTVRERYGVDNVAQSEIVQERMRETCRERYGTDVALASQGVRDKIIGTMVERYGGRGSMSSPDVRDKVKAVCLERYGFENAMLSPEVQQKVLDSKFKNHTFGTSEPEEQLYLSLCKAFGEDDVKRQYRCDRYPFACDFYVVSRDMFIELNGTWTHGSHWFNASDESDAACLAGWSDKGTAYYDNAVRVWSVMDVKKRDYARVNNLNYVVFWDTDLRDAVLWFAMDCPDGRDWDSMYSWLPDRHIEGKPVVPGFTGTSANITAVAKAYQYSVFYERELRLWAENPLIHGLPLHVFLYHNRYKYIGKLPEQLSDSEILHGLNASGTLRKYTSFNIGLMDETVKKYGIKSIYDPCAGWGERTLYCKHHGIDYHGVDVNGALADGYARMVADLGITRQHIVFGDSSVCAPDCTADAVLTCPPYGSLEKYSECGAENLSDNEFLAWWRKVVEQCKLANPRYFCFQINRKWRDRMAEIVESLGFKLVDELFSQMERSSHFTRRGGDNIKKERESMLVFERVGYEPAAEKHMTIKEMRLAVGMSQSKFAKYTHMQLRRLQEWEQGYREPDECIAYLIERVLRLEGKI